jgi:molecular chaperone HtpG
LGKTEVERREFQSEVKQLLNILVYSLYKHKEVFIRELVSNAVDALNKIQFEVLTNEDVEDKDIELRIDILFNETQGKLIVEDTGVGMTKEELIKNIGTIAHSGAVDFLKKLSASKEKDQVDLIGKFGVGFYSSFMVAKEIHVYTKSYRKGSQAFFWKSRGGSNYTIEETTKKQRGTRIELILRKDDKHFLEKYTIQNTLAKYSKFIPFPVYVENEKVDVVAAIWTQPKSSLKQKDYSDFYRFFENTQEDPETYVHLSSDAPVQFNAILFIPKSSLELLTMFKAEPGVDLYSKKVLIQKGTKDIIPEYLRFVKGVIDSEDIPLNISRETIQSNVKIDRIRKHVLKQLFAHLGKIKQKDRKKYLRIWKNFHRHLKEGVATDFENREKISHLLLFHSSKKARNEYVDLKEYVGGMGKIQEEIYYTTGLDLESIEKNPALEAFKDKNIEVLYLDDPLDEFVIEHLRAYAGKPFKMAESADIKVEKEKGKEHLKGTTSFIGYLKQVYGDKVADVKISERLIASPCMLVHPTDAPSVHVEKILKMANKDYHFIPKVLEVNPTHDLIKEMVRIHNVTPGSKALKSLALQLLDNLLLREGIIDDVDSIIPRVQDIMLLAAKTIKSRPGKREK